MKSNSTLILILLNVLVFMGGMGLYVHKQKQQPPPVVERPPVVDDGGSTPIKPQPEPQPINFKITTPNPTYMNYQQTVARLQEWNKEAPDLTEVGTYGKSRQGKDLYYLRIYNKRQGGNKPKVLLTACIHGNEPLSSSTVMWWCGNLLNDYSTKSDIRALLDSRDVYFVPVVSPDSYPNSRHVDGVDPNRDFPGPSRPSHKSTPSVAAIQDLFNKIKPNAVISGHTWGRVFLTPYGDKMAHSENKADYDRIVGHMKTLSGYRMIRACDMYGENGGLNNPPIRIMGEGYGRPIYGSEVDWYYRGGAFAIVCEFGTHQRIPSDADTRTEFDKTYQAAIHFIKEGPLVQIRAPGVYADPPFVEKRGKIGGAAVEEYSDRREE